MHEETEYQSNNWIVFKRNCLETRQKRPDAGTLVPMLLPAWQALFPLG
jgi:hypothetical protein